MAKELREALDPKEQEQTLFLIGLQPTLKKIGGVSKSWMYDMIARGLFPPQVKLSEDGRASKWLDHTGPSPCTISGGRLTISDWLMARLNASQQVSEGERSHD